MDITELSSAFNVSRHPSTGTWVLKDRKKITLFASPLFKYTAEHVLCCSVLTGCLVDECPLVRLSLMWVLTYWWICVCAGILEVLHCILIESPEALNIIQRGHIKSIISLLYKHGRNHKVGGSILVLILLCCDIRYWHIWAPFVCNALKWTGEWR